MLAGAAAAFGEPQLCALRHKERGRQRKAEQSDQQNCGEAAHRGSVYTGPGVE